MIHDSTVRCFLAINPEERVKKHISDWILSLRCQSPKLKWVQDEALHITLKFCGEIEVQDLEKLQSLLETFFKENRMPPFGLQLGSTGAFPSFRRPRTLWIGVEDGLERLSSLADAVDNISGIVGIPVEKRRFHPHITVARIKTPSDFFSPVKEEFEQKYFRNLKWNVKEVELIQSTLTPRGSLYTTLRSYELKS